MGDDQCNLCLSCGAPFLPNGDEIDLFDKRGNLSILHINMEFKSSRELISRINSPKFSGKPQDSHLFHRSHHQAALIHMCEHHTQDSDLADPTINPLNPIPQTDGAMPFYETPSSSSGPRLAWWDAPEERIQLDSLRTKIQQIAARHRDNLDETFVPGYHITCTLCENCNALMTASAYFDYLLGCGVQGNTNEGASLIQDTPIHVCFAKPNKRMIRYSYDYWKPNAVQSFHPTRDSRDILAPHVAYYLHMCLPEDTSTFPGVDSPISVRKLYIIQSWLILQIAALCSLIDQKKRYGNGKLSHGIMQHIGCIELYASYFWWRLACYEHSNILYEVGIDFVQWHQKYIWYAAECPALFQRGAIGECLAFKLYSTTDMPSRHLIERIGAKLVRIYNVEISHIVNFIISQRAAVPPQVRQYFPRPSIIPHLRQLSTDRCTYRNFDTYLRVFGVTALLSRSIQLCRSYPEDLKAQLKDWKRSWQQMEIQNVRRKQKNKVDFFHAHAQYAFCTLLQPPAGFPQNRTDITKAMCGPNCCPWACVLSLHAVGAFKF